MVAFFKDCHYPDKVIGDALTRAKLLVRENTLTYKLRETIDRPIVVIPFHPHNIPLKRIILKHWTTECRARGDSDSLWDAAIDRQP